jgi:glycine oxidase
MIKNTSDITLIGSGIIGLLTAKQFLQAGATVTLIEKNPSSQEASWAGGGILLPLYPWRQAAAISDLVIPSLKSYPLLATELMTATQLDPEWTQCGLLITQNPDVEVATNWCKTAQIPATTAENSFFSAVNSQFLQPLWLPSIAQVRNPRLLKSLRAFLLQKGARFIDNCALMAVEQKKQRVNAIETTHGKLAVHQLIIATGAWTGELSQTLFPECANNASEIKPVKGQMLLFDAKPDMLNHIVLEGEHYLIPRRDGKILAGSSVEYTGFDKSVSAAMKTQLYDFATRLLPALKNFPVSKQWAGLRPGTEHGIPYIAIHPEIENLSINAGHFRNGLTMAPASAQLLADLILKRPSLLDPAPYQLTR